MTFGIWIAIGIVVFMASAVTEIVGGNDLFGNNTVGETILFAALSILMFPALILYQLFNENSGLNKIVANW